MPRFTHTTLRPLPVLLATAALLAGCGSDKSKPAASVPVPPAVTTPLASATTPDTTTDTVATTPAPTATTDTTGTVATTPETTSTPTTTTGGGKHTRTTTTGTGETVSGGGETSSGGASTLAKQRKREAAAKAAYIRYADGVCTNYRDQVIALDATKAGSIPAQRARKIVELFTNALGQLNGRPRPTLDADTIAGYLSLLAQQRLLLISLADAAARKDTGTVRVKRQAVFDVSVKARNLAQDYGLKVCGN